MAESTRSKSNMERIEEAIVKLATNHLNVSNKLDDLLNRVSAIEANQQRTTTAPLLPQYQSMSPTLLRDLFLLLFNPNVII